MKRYGKIAAGVVALFLFFSPVIVRHYLRDTRAKRVSAGWEKPAGEWLAAREVAKASGDLDREDAVARDIVEFCVKWEAAKTKYFGENVHALCVAGDGPNVLDFDAAKAGR